MATFVDAEDVVQEWVLATPSIVTAVGVNSSGGPNVYLGMPTGSPLPALVLTRTGGAPSSLSNLPVDYARITLDCWGNKRSVAKSIATAVVSAVQSLNESADFITSNGARIHGAQVLLILFRPDQTQAKPVPRYLVDVQFALIAAQAA